MDAIITGAISGVIAGLAISIFLGCYTRIVKWWNHRDQVRRIRKLIFRSKDEILAVLEGEDGLMPGQPISVPSGVARDAIFIGMRRELDWVLDDRASAITFDEKMDIWKIWVVDDLIKNQTPPRIRSAEILDHFFGEFAKLSWLNLPKGPASNEGPVRSDFSS